MSDEDLYFNNDDEIDRKINKDLKEIKEKLRKRLEEELKK